METMTLKQTITKSAEFGTGRARVEMILNNGRLDKFTVGVGAGGSYKTHEFPLHIDIVDTVRAVLAEAQEEYVIAMCKYEDVSTYLSDYEECGYYDQLTQVAQKAYCDCGNMQDDSDQMYGGLFLKYAAIQDLPVMVWLEINEEIEVWTLTKFMQSYRESTLMCGTLRTVASRLADFLLKSERPLTCEYVREQCSAQKHDSTTNIGVY